MLATIGVLSVVAVGCGRGQQPTAPAQPSTATTTGGVAVSPLARRGDLPPEGVAKQADFFIGGDSGCVGYEGGPPPARIHLAETTVLSPRILLVCFPGFARGRPLTLEVARPDGVVRRFGGSRDSGGGISVPVLPGEPFGRYALRARQGSVTASAIVTVKPATQPTVVVVGAESDPRLGAPIKLALGGFPRNASARIHAYVRDSPGQSTGQYVTSFQVPTDGHGQGTLTIPTRSDDPAGCYGFHWTGLQKVLHFFCLAVPPPPDEQPAAGAAPGTVPASAAGVGEVVLRDDFSRRGRWAEGGIGPSASGYVDGQYRFRLSGPYGGVAMLAPRSQADLASSTRVEVDATRVSSSRALFGVTCRFNPGGLGVGGFYLGAIDTRGYWIISRFLVGGGPVFSFAPGVPSPARTLARAERQPQYSPAIRSSGTNRVGLMCNGGDSPGAPVTLRLYINGYEVAEVEDPRGLGPGRHGLWAQSSNEPIEVRFDNFTVSRP